MSDRNPEGMPERVLLKNQHGQSMLYVADALHAQLSVWVARDGPGEWYHQAREWDENVQTVRDIDFADYKRPQSHLIHMDIGGFGMKPDDRFVVVKLSRWAGRWLTLRNLECADRAWCGRSSSSRNRRPS
jgi:hypothetical protein